MKKLLVVILVMFAFGCAKKHVQVHEHEKDKGVEGVPIQSVQEEISHEEAHRMAEARDVEATEIQEQPLFEFRDALFDFDKYNIRSDAREVLDSIAKWLNENRDIAILVEGHCDERGTNEYNLALGEKRAKAARDYLVTRGVDHVRINTITYGEERPVCTDSNESCWQSNRRAHFVVTR